MKNNNDALESDLDAFDATRRLAALEALAARTPAAAPYERVNLHLHSFFSYNSRDWSPARLAWEARRAGLYAAGLCDFDVLDGLEEFLEAGQLLGLRAVVHLETRAFLRAYAAGDVNSPGEPGVSYIMGAGFTRAPDPATPEGRTLARLREQAEARNRALVGRINARLPPIAVDYARDVLPLTPAGCPTERHLVRAYRLRAAAAFPAAADHAAFWSPLLKVPAEKMTALVGDLPAWEEKMRAALVKAGGIGYERPTEQSFPPADAFARWVRACGALPTMTWLDGTTPAEADGEALLACLRAEGVCAVNIIPDRNHRIADPAVRAVKRRKLDEIVTLCERLHLPLIIGTEMNKDGQPFFDDTQGEALRPYHDAFLRGARVLVGHTWLARFAACGYAGAAAEAEFGDATARKNAVFASVGSLPPVTCPLARRLEDMGPAKALAYLRDSAARGKWE